MERIFSEEQADSQIDTLFAHYRCDREMLPEGQKAALEMPLVRIREAIMLGELEIIQEGVELKVIQHLSQSYPKLNDIQDLSYSQITAKIRRQIPDISEKINRYSQIYYFVQAMTGLSKNQMDCLTLTDLSLAEALGSLFFLF